MRKKFAARFLGLARERLERLNNDFLAVEQTQDEQLAVRLLRELHTLKGESQLTGFKQINRVCHSTEEVLHAARDRGFHFSPVQVACVLAGFDLIGSLLESEESPATLARVEAFAAMVVAAQGGANDPQKDAAHDPSSKDPTSNSTGQGGASATDGDTERADTEPAQITAPTVSSVQQAEASVTRSQQHLRVPVDQLDQLTDAASDLLLAHAMDERILERATASALQSSEILTHLRMALARVGNVEEASRGALEGSLHELTALIAQLSQPFRELSPALQELGESAFSRRVGLEAFDDHLRGLRLLPVSTLFDRFPRAVRELAARQGKQVRVEMTGGQVSIDKQVLDRVADPLLHLVRNAVDHGIETPEERAVAGKPAQAVLTFGARQVGSLVEISVRDDGRGLDINAIRERAVERGLLNPDEAATFSHDAIAELIFRSGFSTRSVVTDVSGRGVGLDVVRQLVNAVGGKTQIETKPGRGTTFRLLLPVSAVLSRALMVEVGDHVYAFPSGAVQAVVARDPAKLEITAHARSFLWNGQRVPAADLGALLGRDPVAQEGGACPLVVTEYLGELMGFFVSRFLGQQQVVHRPLEAFLAELRLVMGSVVLPDGRLALVINVGEAMRHAAFAPVRRVQQAAQRQRSVLVVDDSEFTRDMVVGVLRLAGFKVFEAVNGRQGLERYQQHQPDLVLTDLDMPVMDGFGLVKEIRALASGKHTPILVFSTRGSDADKRRAADLGADGYVVKAEFREQALIQMVHSFVARGDEANA